MRVVACLAFAGLLLLPLQLAGCSNSAEVPDDAGDANDAADLATDDNYATLAATTTPATPRENTPRETPRAQQREAPLEDRRLHDALHRARGEFDRGEYAEAMRTLESVATLRPLSEEAIHAFRVQANMTRAFDEVLGQIEPINRREMVRVIFHGGSSIEGFVMERGRNTLLLRVYTGGFHRVDTRPSEVYRVDVLTREQQREELARRFERIERRFGEQPRTAVEIARLAREARRYDQPARAHELMLDAFALDPWVDQSLLMEADEDYVALRHATQEGNRDRAHELLGMLQQRYPHASLFQQPVALAVEPDAEPTAEPEPDPEPVIAEAAQRIFDDVEEHAEEEAQEARQSLRVDIDEEIPNLARLDAEQLVRLADRHRDNAKRHERGATPGRAGSMEALDEAIYHYRLAQELYRRALRAGADEQEVNPRLTDVNRGLFWARRLRPID